MNTNINTSGALQKERNKRRNRRERIEKIYKDTVRREGRGDIPQHHKMANPRKVTKRLNIAKVREYDE